MVPPLMIKSFRAALLVICLAQFSHAEGPLPGDLLWTVQAAPQGNHQDSFTEPAIGPDGTVYVGHIPSHYAPSGIFYAINPDGTTRWSKSFNFTLASHEGHKMGFGTASVAPDGTVHFKCGDTHFAYTSDGEERWKRIFVTPEYRTPTVWIHSAAISEDGSVYLPVDLHGLYRLNPATGANVWFRSEYYLKSAGSITLDGNVWITGDSFLFRFAHDGQINSQITGTKQFSPYSPSLNAAGHIYMVPRLGVVRPGASNVGLDSQYPSITVPPLIGPQNEIIFPDRSGNLYCLEADFTLRWKLTGYADQSPILAEDGTIFAITSDPRSPTIRALGLDGAFRYEIAGKMDDPGATLPPYYDYDSYGLPLIKLALGRTGTLYAAARNGKLYAFHGTSPLGKSDWPKVFGGYGNASRVTHLAPEITRQPVGGSVISGQMKTLSVEWIGRPAPAVQWYRDGQIIPGATAANLQVGFTGLSDQGDYHAVLANSAGTTESATVSVDVQHRLTLNTTGSGSVALDPPGPDYQEGSAITLTATAADGFAFHRWSGSASGSENPLTIEINHSRIVVAEFVDLRRTLTVTKTGMGEVDVNPPGPVHLLGTEVTLTAQPAPGFAFDGWSGVEEGGSNPLVLEITKSQTVTARFVDIRRTLTVTKTGTGEVDVSPPGPVHLLGTEVTLTAHPAPGFAFDGWNGVEEGGSNPLVLEITKTQTVTARFVDIRRTLTVTTTGIGEVEVDPPGPVHLLGDRVELTASPGPGHVFDGWEGGADGILNPLSVEITASETINAIFRDVEVPLLLVDGEFPAVVKDPVFHLTGEVTDNAGIQLVTVATHGGAPVSVALAGSLFNTNVPLKFGQNPIVIRVVDINGLETSRSLSVEWAPDRYWLIQAPETVGEAHILEADVVLGSTGDVAGANITITTDPTYLSYLDFIPAGLPKGAFTTLSESNGVVNFTFASLGKTLDSGETLVGRVRYRVRSLPGPLPAAVTLNQLNLAALDGSPISKPSGIRNPVVQLVPRSIIGDVNNNGRFDAGDAQYLQRLLGGLEEIRSWDHAINDVNGSGALDIGDVIMVLRTVARLRDQPGHQPSLLRAFGFAKVESTFSLHSPTARLVVDKPHAPPGETVTVKVMLDHVPSDFGGASFVLEYPVEALRLLNENSHYPGPLQPASALQVWSLGPAQEAYNNQSGTVAFAAGSANTWPGSGQGGVVAEFVFTVQPGASAQGIWPIRLVELELSTEDGLSITPGNLLGSAFVGQPVSWQAWLAANFSAADLEDASRSGPDADPDADGRSNRVEYLMGTNPNSPDAGEIAEPVLMDLAGGTAHFGIRYRHDPKAVGTAPIVQWSDDMKIWNNVLDSSAGGHFRQVDWSVDSADGTVMRTVIDSREFPAAKSRFMRLQFEAPQ